MASLFESTSTRLGLPYLFAGQAQKEGHVNEALARIDALLHGAIEGRAAVPPASAADGQCWLVGEGAQGEWSGRTGQIAAREAGNWLFFAPRDGMRLLNRGTGQELRYAAGWLEPVRPASPAGGAVADAEARAAIAALLDALAIAGVLPAT